MVPGKPSKALLDRVALVDRRVLLRDSLTQNIVSYSSDIEVKTFMDVDSWIESPVPPRVALVSFQHSEIDNGTACALVRRALQVVEGCVLVVLSDQMPARQVVDLIGSGARGVLSRDTTIDVLISSLRLAAAGGVFVPQWVANQIADLVRGQEERSPIWGKLTRREYDVANCLRVGKANKVIAFELNISESTVKVHIRNIMKKIGATNRTEASHILDRT